MPEFLMVEISCWQEDHDPSISSEIERNYLMVWQLF